MIARLGKNQKLPGKWEFPGGKLKPGESIYQYGQEPLRLVCYYVKWKAGEPVLKIHDEVRWVEKDELVKYDFSPAVIP